MCVLSDGWGRGEGGGYRVPAGAVVVVAGKGKGKYTCCGSTARACTCPPHHIHTYHTTPHTHKAGK